MLGMEVKSLCLPSKSIIDWAILAPPTVYTLIFLMEATRIQKPTLFSLLMPPQHVHSDLSRNRLLIPLNTELTDEWKHMNQCAWSNRHVNSHNQKDRSVTCSIESARTYWELGAMEHFWDSLKHKQQKDRHCKEKTERCATQTCGEATQL